MAICDNCHSGKNNTNPITKNESTVEFWSIEMAPTLHTICTNRIIQA